MRLIASGIAIVLALAACGQKKPAEEPENTEETASSDESKSSDKSSAESESSSSSATLGGSAGATHLSSRPPAEKATIRDDTEKKAAPCAGMNIPNLFASLAQAACELPEGASPSTQQATKDSLEVTLTAAATIAPGSTAQVSVVLKNKSKAKLPLDFTVDPDPRFKFELATPKGARVDKPAGNEPSLPAQTSAEDVAQPRLARITLDPNGSATLLLPWQAVKYKWAPKEKAKGALAGHGYPREPAGPLPKGKYVLRLVMPLANVDEGVDHEITQPRTNVEIAGAVEVAAAPPAESAAPKKAAAPEAGPATPAASASSEASVESKFLKVVGGAPSAAPSAAPATSARPPAKKH
jgi:predicted small lipoprotein YifL